ncbi:MAG TPA: hypothetical protein VFX30_06335 [bacterium]|nr:hypothetical protein [bacterium]
MTAPFRVSPILIPDLSLPVAVNAISLGTDRATAAPRSLWEPDATLMAQASASFAMRLPLAPKEAFLAASPDDQAILRKDSYDWTVENRRPLAEGAFVKVLASRIRAELQKILASEDVPPAARRIALRQIVYVRIVPGDGSLENYGVEIFPSPPPDLNYRQVQWSLDPSTGALRPLDLMSHAVFLLRAEAAGTAASEESRLAFIPFYRSIRFASRALRAESLLEELPERQRRRLLEASTPAPVASRGPGLMTRLRGLFENVAAEQHTRVMETKSVLVRYIAKARAGVEREMEDYFSANTSLTEDGRRFVRRLTNEVVSELYRREAADASYSRWACLWVWLRRNEGEDYGRLEMVAPDKMLGHGPRENDLLFMLIRDDEAMNTDLCGLVHVYNRSHMVGNAQRPLGADLAFEAFLGLGPADKFVLRLDHLHRSPRNLAEWDRWMVENRHWRKR